MRVRMLTTCSVPGCSTLVMGGRCLEHEALPSRVFVRGRPFVSGAQTLATSHVAGGTQRIGDALLDFTPSPSFGLELSRT